MEEEDEEEVESVLHALASSEENPWARMRRTEGLVILVCSVSGFIFLERMALLVSCGESRRAGTRMERSTKGVIGKLPWACVCVCVSVSVSGHLRLCLFFQSTRPISEDLLTHQKKIRCYRCKVDDEDILQ